MAASIGQSASDGVKDILVMIGHLEQRLSRIESFLVLDPLVRPDLPSEIAARRMQQEVLDLPMPRRSESSCRETIDSDDQLAIEFSEGGETGDRVVDP